MFYEDHECHFCKAKDIPPLDLFIYEYRIGDVTQSVSAENQLKRIGHTETVLKRMTAEGKSFTGAAALYCAKRNTLCRLSFLVTFESDKTEKQAEKEPMK